MKILQNDYVIGNDGKKNWLLQVSSVNDNMVYGHLDLNRAYSPSPGEFMLSNIVANLGQRPPPGNAYGCLIEPFVKSSIHTDWGDIHWHVWMAKSERLALKKGLDNIASKLKSQKLFGFVSSGNLAIEVRPPKGQFAGMYHYKTVKGEAKDRMILKPKHDVDMGYLVAHESGHGVWFRLMSSRMHARWIRLYHSYMKTTAYSPHDLRKLRDSYIEDSMSVKDFRSQLPEEACIVFDSCISTLCSDTRISQRSLDILASNGMLDTIKEDWPLSMSDSDFDIALTEYGTKNPEEFFAEAFALHITGKQLPKRVNSVMQKTLKAVI